MAILAESMITHNDELSMQIVNECSSRKFRTRVPPRNIFARSLIMNWNMDSLFKYLTLDIMSDLYIGNVYSSVKA